MTMVGQRVTDTVNRAFWLRYRGSEPRPVRDAPVLRLPLSRFTLPRERWTMNRYSVIYTRQGDRWSAEILDFPGLVASRNTFAGTRVAVRAALGRQLGVDPWDVDLEELVDAGESRYARLA